MPELPPYLREGMSETDYKTYADRLKPHVDKALGARSPCCQLAVARNTRSHSHANAPLFEVPLQRLHLVMKDELRGTFYTCDLDLVGF
jgi:hypothetical protein